MKRLLLAFLFLSCTSFCFLQAQVNNVTKYTVEDGLSHNQIDWAYQDSRGVMWIGAINGINRYDGTAFKFVAKYDFFEWESEVILEDHEGDLWIRSRNPNKSITMFNIYSQKIKKIEEKFGEEISFTKNDIYKVAALSDKVIVLGLMDQRLVYYDLLQQKELKSIKTTFLPKQIYTSPDHDGFWACERIQKYAGGRSQRTTAVYFINENDEVEHISNFPWFSLYNFPIYDSGNLLLCGPMAIYEISKDGSLNKYSYSDFLHHPNKKQSLNHVSGNLSYDPEQNQFWYSSNARLFSLRCLPPPQY